MQQQRLQRLVNHLAPSNNSDHGASHSRRVRKLTTVQEREDEVEEEVKMMQSNPTAK